MDRFIAHLVTPGKDKTLCLKSNMDRFIVFLYNINQFLHFMFKIQYG